MAAFPGAAPPFGGGGAPTAPTAPASPMAPTAPMPSRPAATKPRPAMKASARKSLKGGRPAFLSRSMSKGGR